MTYFSHLSLQQALYQLLDADSQLRSLVSGIYDHVPQEALYPFITIGEASIRDWSNLETQGTEQTLIFRVYSRGAGRKEAATIMERIVTLVNNAALTVSGQSLKSLRFTGSQIQLENDGFTYRGTLTFRALLSAFL